MKTTIDRIIMSQPNIPVRLVPKSKFRVPAIIIQWENTGFGYFTLLSVLLTLLYFCAVSECYNFSCKFPCYHWPSTAVFGWVSIITGIPSHFPCYSRVPGPGWLWLLLEPLLLFSPRHVRPSSILFCLYWEFRPGKLVKL